MFYVTTGSDRVKARTCVSTPRSGSRSTATSSPIAAFRCAGEAQLVAEGEIARPITRRIAARDVPADALDAMVETLMEAPRVVFAIKSVCVTKMGSW